MTMETPYLTYCDKTKTYCTNLITITKSIYNIEYVANDRTRSFVEKLIDGYEYSKDCKGTTIEFVELNFIKTNINTFSGFKLTKVTLGHINNIYNVVADTLQIMGMCNIDTIHDIEVETLVAEHCTIGSIYNSTIHDWEIDNIKYIGSVHHITMVDDEINLSNVAKVGSIHDISVEIFRPPKKVNYLYNITVPTLDLSNAEYVKTIHDIEMYNKFIGCKVMENIYNITIDTLDLSTTKHMDNIYNIATDNLIPPENTIRVSNITTKTLDFSKTRYLGELYDVNIEKFIGGKKVCAIFDSTIQTLDLSLCDYIDKICSVQLMTFTLPKHIPKMLNIKRVEDENVEEELCSNVNAVKVTVNDE